MLITLIFPYTDTYAVSKGGSRDVRKMLLATECQKRTDACEEENWP